MEKKFTVISMNKNSHRTIYRGCDQSEKDEEVTDEVEYTLHCVDEGGYKYKITLSQTNGVCPSGWTDASWGNISIDRVDAFGGFTHSPIYPLEFSLNIKRDGINGHYVPVPEPNEEYENDEYMGGIEIETEIFSVSEDGSDEYYPSGYVKVHEELFTSNIRYTEQVFVHLFTGESNTGKSFLAALMEGGKTVYETDSCKRLPKTINQEIIVVGNKYKFLLTDVIKRIPNNSKIVKCDFSTIEVKNE